MAILQKVDILINANIQAFFDTQCNYSSEFKAEYERFERLINVDDRYLNDITVGEMRAYQFSTGDAIVYSLVTEAVENNIKSYVIEIECFIPKKAREALKAYQGLLKRCWRVLCLGVARANDIQFWIEIAIAIGILSILFTSKFLSNDVPEIKNNRPVPEQQAPKLTPYKK